MQKRWIMRETDPSSVAQLKEDLNIRKIYCELLDSRNIKSIEEAKTFFNPDVTQIHDPFLMKDMDLAVDRISRAIDSEESILLYGDYDVDGTTSVATAHAFFSPIHENLAFYIPNRYKEGYGISYEGIDFAAANGYTLVLAMDCGIRAVKKVAYAKERGIDFIICDHHIPHDKLPEAAAVLDPKRKDCSYPFKDLSGCGVLFKLIHAYSIRQNLRLKPVWDLLDLVAVSTTCDIVPIYGENRALVALGMDKLSKQARTGLEAMIQVAKKIKPLTVSDVVFYIGPMINVAGRLNDAKEAVRILINPNYDEAKEAAQKLWLRNNERKEIQQAITDEALQLKTNVDPGNTSNSIVLFDPAWHKGIVGIVASKIVDTYYRPTLILTESEGKLVGSARSVRGFDVHEALIGCQNLLENFGGHKYAAGLTMSQENLEPFKSRFEEVVTNSITTDQLIPIQYIDAEMDFAEIDFKLFNTIRRFAPFGPQNRTPVFVTKGVENHQSPRILKDAHLKLKVKQSDHQNKVMDAIAFGMSDKLKEVYNGPFDICYTLSKNSYKGRETLQLMIKDIKSSGES